MRRTLILINSAYALLLIVMALVPRVPSLPGFSRSDLLAHALAYGIQAALLFRLLDFFPAGRAAPITAVTGATGLGILTEFLQLLTPGRQFDTVDMLADFLGALVVVLLYRSLRFLHKERET